MRAFLLVIFTVLASQFAMAQQQQVADSYYTIDEPTQPKDNFNFMSAEIELLNNIKQRFYSLVRFKLHKKALTLSDEPYMRRTHFGRWINDPTDDTCQNTRAKVLVRDSTKEVTFRNDRKCVVDTGEWQDSYTGLTLHDSREIQVDHMIPLKHAWTTGAWRWDFRARCLFANFMEAEYHLVPVYARENMSKGDRGPNAYMPPNQQFTCQYLKNWLRVKLTWKLALTEVEINAIRDQAKAANCSAQDLKMTTAELRNLRASINTNLDYCILNRRQ